MPPTSPPLPLPPRSPFAHVIAAIVVLVVFVILSTINTTITNNNIITAINTNTDNNANYNCNHNYDFNDTGKCNFPSAHLTNSPARPASSRLSRRPLLEVAAMGVTMGLGISTISDVSSFTLTWNGNRPPHALGTMFRAPSHSARQTPNRVLTS